MQRAPLPTKFRLTNVDIWNASGIRRGCDVLVEHGQVQKILNRSSEVFESYVSVDGGGYALLPTGVDPQVHLRVPGQSEKETPSTGLRACIRGAYGAILTMPNTKPVIDSPSALDLGRSQLRDAERETGIEVLWSAAVTRGQEGRELVDIAALARAGAVAFTDDGRGVASDELMDLAFAQLAPIGAPFLQHAEMPGHGGVLAPGPSQRKLGVASYPADAEWRMVERDLRVLRRHPRARYHVLHISTKETVALLREAKREGLRVSGEASPHHLLLTSDDVPVDDSSYKMNPPLRLDEDRQALLAGLAAGDIDFVATDHAPHEASKKTTDFAEAAFGTTGLETSLRALLELYKQKKLSAERLVDAFSTKPAQFLGIDDRFGAIAEGRPFNAALVDADAAPVAIGRGELESLSKNNCFIGRPLAGKIKFIYQPASAWTL